MGNSMSELSPRDKFELARAYKDAATKLAGFDDRLKDELQQAEAEDREPLPIEPLTAIPGYLLVYAIDQVKGDPAPELREIMKAQRRAGSLHPNRSLKNPELNQNLPSHHLKMILDAAGFGPKTEPKPAPTEEDNGPQVQG